MIDTTEAEALGEADETTAARRRGRWGPVAVVGLAGLVVGVELVGLARQFEVREGITGLLVATVLIGGPATLLALLWGGWALWRLWPSAWALVAVPVLDVVLTVLLARPLGTGFGLVTCAYLALPSLLLAVGCARRSRRAVLAVGLALGALFAVAFPLGAVQRQLAVEQWLRTTGTPSRAVVLPVDPPGLARAGLRWDGRRMVITFGTPEGQGGSDTLATVVETVTPGYGDPCGPLSYGTEGDPAMADPPCAREASGLWFRGYPDAAGSVPGYVLQRDGVTITLTDQGAHRTPGGQLQLTGLGNGGDQPLFGRDGLRRVIESAHPAAADDVRPKGWWLPRSWAGLLL
ncbi:hypothetical protein OG455_11340 [Kitasatospora sp. NBC_01287]|uniref:hypothetical protein n=1 Tax=Kitasatospora sp. NBC_01287 TaxID=2903573 RepID=UPI00224F2C02|nr:hypothetical protein [Kitasatospora sp. NBC_01287]MCX4746108.1 hypothetical protein [Kitasatospora sp. NBC_01287]